jgi:hypothetical protein
MSIELDPKKFIGRECEQGLFEELLEPATATQILAISAKEGDGKSRLLEKFKLRCRTRSPHIPVSLIALSNHSSPLTLVQNIVKDLTLWGIRFDKYRKYNAARLVADYGPFIPPRGSVLLQGADFTNSQNPQISGIMTNVNTAGTVSISNAPSSLTPEQEKDAQEVVIAAFFDDLHDHCANKRVVLMLDSFDKCDDELKDWIMGEFFQRNFIIDRCDSCLLGLVIAGKKTPDFRMLWSEEKCDSKLLSIDELGQWTKEDVAECLRAHGVNNCEADALDILYGMIIKLDTPVIQVVQAIEYFSKKHRGQQ